MNGAGMRGSLRVIFEIVKKEFYQVRQDKRMLSVSLIAPILQVLLLGYAATTDIKYSNLAVCGMDKTAQLRSTNYMVPGVLGTVLMIITMTLTSLGIVKEKEIGTLEQLLVTPIKPYELILGKLIPFILIGFVDVLVVLAIARFWFGVPMVGSLALLFGLSALFILTTLGLGLFISTLAKSQQQAMLIAQFFFFMPSTFLS